MTVQTMARLLGILTVLLTLISFAGVGARENIGCPVSVLEQAEHDQHGNVIEASHFQSSDTDHAAVSGVCKSGCGTIAMMLPELEELHIAREGTQSPIPEMRGARSGSPSPYERPPRSVV
jgi:hypothetical protein